MKTSESITNIAVALHRFHGLMGKVGKDATNPHFKNKYASLSNIIEATTPHLNAVGLSIIQLPCESGLETMLLHTSGEHISSVSLTPCKDASNPQALGSALTYAKRYSYAGALNLNIDEDDDANAATAVPKQVTQPKPQPKVVPKAERIIVSEGDETFLKIVKAVSEGKATIQQAIDKYSISEEVEASLKDKIQLLAQIVG
jgi:hypothetical protein